jgi:hypothetical protein
LAVGLLSLLVFVLVGGEVLGDVDLGNPFLEVVAYGLLANFFYTFGWITEILWRLCKKTSDRFFKKSII